MGDATLAGNALKICVNLRIELWILVTYRLSLYIVCEVRSAKCEERVVDQALARLLGRVDKRSASTEHSETPFGHCH